MKTLELKECSGKRVYVVNMQNELPVAGDTWLQLDDYSDYNENYIKRSSQRGDEVIIVFDDGAKMKLNAEDLCEVERGVWCHCDDYEGLSNLFDTAYLQW